MSKRHKITIYSIIGQTWDGKGITAQSVADAMKEMDPEECDGVDVFINSPGGSVFEGTAIANELRRCEKPVDIYVAGMAASAASIIAMAGAKVVMEPGAWMMVHNASGGCYGNRADMGKMQDTLGKIDGEIAAAYAQRTGKSVKAMAKLMDEETWLNAKDAVKMGFADETGTLPEEDDPEEEDEPMDIAALAAFGYRHVPAEIAARFQGPPPRMGVDPSGVIWITPAVSAASAVVAVTPHSQEESIMPEVKSEKPEQPKAATVKELKAALPNATAEFIMAQAEKDATLAEAKDAYLADVEAQNKALATDLAAAKATPPAAPGLDPVSALANGSKPTAEGTATEQWDALIAAQMATGKTRQKAFAFVSRQNPDLRAAYVAEYNDAHPIARGR